MSNLKINSLNECGYFHDGGGLYLQITKQKNKSWIFRYTKMGKNRELGLGPLRYVTLADARSKRDHMKKMLIEGVDPLLEKIKLKKERQISEAKKVSFEVCALRYIETHRVKWKNEKHGSQWESTLRTYAFPTIGHLPVDEINTQLVLKVINPIWTTISETASRVRNRIEIILNWAKVSGFRSGENPARWHGHLENILPKRSEVQKTKHFAALPYKLISNFMFDLRQHSVVAALGLEFLILTAARTNEVMGATWNEIDLETKTWIIPEERMKAEKPHRVPLSPRAIEILNVVPRNSLNPLIFQNDRTHKKLSSSAFLALLKRMGYDITAHGFRSSFRDWAAEETNYPREVAESSLAHTLKDKVEAAYRRGDFFEKRKGLMCEWSEYCNFKKSEATYEYRIKTQS